MKIIPENNNDIKEILYKQIGLLAEASEKNKSEPDILVKLSEAMKELTDKLCI